MKLSKFDNYMPQINFIPAYLFFDSDYYTVLN